jgi:hypothetical protein
VGAALPPTADEREAKVEVRHAHHILRRGGAFASKRDVVVIRHACHQVCAINST